MSRRQRLLKHIDHKKQGIEVAPYFAPLLPKAEGFKVLTLDVFDTERLRDNARQDIDITEDGLARIEPVDLVGDASSIADLVRASPHGGDIHYVVSSHNFEHLPNPLKFLRGCTDLLAPDGVISMAVPDGRACFDHYRMPTRLSDWLDAFHEDRTQPSAATLFDSIAYNATFSRDGQRLNGCRWESDNPEGFCADNGLGGAFDIYNAAQDPAMGYRDAHCSVFFPESLRLMFADLIFMGQLDLEVIDITPTRGLEFFVHLRKPVNPVVREQAAFYALRADLLADVSRAMGKGGWSDAAGGQAAARQAKPRLSRRIEDGAKSVLRTLVGPSRFQKLHDWHKRTARDRLR